MSDAYVECLVKSKPTMKGKLLKALVVFLTIAFAVLCFLTFNMIFFILAVAAGVGVYFVNQMTDLEYEYLYLDKELTIDKVMAKTRRKRIAVYSLGKIEIMAPFKSYRLDNYKNRQVKTIDFSIGYEDQPDRRYVVYYEGNVKLILSPSEDLVKIMKNAAPRKVFTD